MYTLIFRFWGMTMIDAMMSFDRAIVTLLFIMSHIVRIPPIQGVP